MKIIKGGHPAKIIFLDIDGVINIPPYNSFNENCQKVLQEILIKTEAKIVISSSWRESNTERMLLNFKEHNLFDYISQQIIGITSRAYSYVKPGSGFPLVRGNEIKHYLDTNLIYPWIGNKELDSLYKIPEEKVGEMTYYKGNTSNKLNKDYSYLILDDDTDMLYDQRNNFINTNGLLGLIEGHIKQAEDILNIIN